MQAVILSKVGDPSVLQYTNKHPQPEIASATQIKVRLNAAGVNPIDTKVRGNGLFFGAQTPAIIGCDGAGEIVAIGEKVDRFKIGDPVWFCHGGLGREQGNYAEYTVIEQSLVDSKPENINFIEAAAAPLVLITAWEALFDQGRLLANETVLIHAGAGGVGHVAIQLAKHKGARVICTVGTAENEKFVKSLGADEVINYHSEDVIERCKTLTKGQGINLCLDTVGAEVFRQSIEVMAPYGRLVTLLDPGPGLDLSAARLKNIQIAFTLMLSPAFLDLHQAQQHQVGILEQCRELIEDQQLQIKVSQSLPLEQAAEAHRLIETGHTRGKLVLTLSSP